MTGPSAETCWRSECRNGCYYGPEACSLSRDPDCDLCYPENHTDCTRKPYNGAAGHMITGTHRRCEGHSQSVTL